MLRLSYDRIDLLFGKISSINTLYLPVDKVYKKYESGDIYNEKELNTLRSAKDFFFPQVENIAKFKLNGKKIEIIENDNDYDNEPFVLFGVRACDEKSFRLLDSVFLSAPADVCYKNRRENATVITTACNEPEESCFCTSFSISPYAPCGDVSTWISDGFIYWRSNTDKGAKLTSQLADIFEQCDDSCTDNIKADIKNIVEKLPIGEIDFSYWENTSEKEIFANEKWDEIYKSCLGCGACTFVCPTCQCYDIKDFDCGSSVQRFRCWDSCMYSDFTLMAHGNPRKTQKERFRQRFMHKLKYFPVNNDGEYSCVGCGRCVRSCPQRLNIIKVLRSVPND